MALWENGKFTCECGCGEEVQPFGNYAIGHKSKTIKGKQRLSEVMQKRWQDSEYRRRHVGWHHTDETCKLISQSHAGISLSAEHCKKMSESRIGIPHNHGRKISESLTGRIFTDEHRQHLSEASMGKTLTDKHRKALSEAKRKNWRDPEYVRMMMGSRGTKPNQMELLLWRDIQEYLSSGWEVNVGGEKSIMGLVPDFIHEDRKQVIELFGNYYHDEFLTGRTAADKIERYGDAGYDCIVVWEEDVRDGTALVELERFK